MDEQQYLSERVDAQINWLDGKAAFNQRRFKRIRIIELVSSASIPFLVALITDATVALKWITGLMGITITVCEGLQAMYKYQELWIQYRSIAETLKREKLLYLTKAGRYEGIPNPFPQLVVEVESILGQENAQWKSQTESIEKVK